MIYNNSFVSAFHIRWEKTPPWAVPLLAPLDSVAMPSEASKILYFSNGYTSFCQLLCKLLIAWEEYYWKLLYQKIQ